MCCDDWPKVTLPNDNWSKSNCNMFTVFMIKTLMTPLLLVGADLSMPYASCTPLAYFTTGIVHFAWLK